MVEHLGLAEIKEKIGIPSQEASVCFLIKDDRILLAMKKRGFGIGKWNGSGGKRKPEDKSVEHTAIREMVEEVGVTPKDIYMVGAINFYFISKPDWNQRVIAYLSKSWDGDPKESEEMSPKWFRIDEIPYNQMWEDDRYWLPLVLDGEIIEADFLFDENQRMIEKDIRKITSR